MRRKIKKETILQTGLDLMFLQGYHATGIKDITDRVQIPKGSFYNHFSSKEAFGLAVVKRYCDNGIKLYEEYFIESGLPPLQRFEAFFSALIDKYETELNCKLGCVMSNFAAELGDTNEKFRQLLDDEFARCEAIMENCLKVAQDNGDIGSHHDIKALAAYILNGWHGALVRMKATATTAPLKMFKDLTLKQLLR